MTIAEIKKVQEALSKRKKCDFCVNRISDNDCINCKEDVAVEIADLANMYDITFRTLRNELERLENKPLTLEQLKNMFGEPIFDSYDQEFVILGYGILDGIEAGYIDTGHGNRFYKYKPTENAVQI